MKAILVIDLEANELPIDAYANIHIEGIDWDSEVDDTFEMELEVIKQMVERMQNESSISD